MPSLINSDDGVVSGSAGLKTTGSNDGILALQNNGTTNVTVTAAGNMGIGTTSPAKKLDVYTTGTSAVAQYVRNATVNLLFNVPDGTQGQVGTETNHVLLLLTNNIERGRFDTSGNFLFNSGYGSVATAYGCRAWVNFNGTGTVAIRASGNVSSITDVSTGVYTVNFTASIIDANYAGVVGVDDGLKPGLNSGATASAFGVTARNNANTLTDSTTVTVAIFR